ncbi:MULTISPECIES: tetratricopeptide repeat protein [unclassified Microcoleus]|uniref:tetratricopeptide repeat protein n=1 Tax=unclassified Microcoleus TaxID=2642155 RepID=UPI002FD0C6E2
MNKAVVNLILLLQNFATRKNFLNKLCYHFTTNSKLEGWRFPALLSHTQQTRKKIKMKNRHLFILTCLSSFLLISPVLSGCDRVNSFVQQFQSTGIAKLSEPALKELSESITVRVTTHKSGGGSGTLIHKDGSSYTVLTNAHVLGEDEAPYRIETPDKKTYSASVVENVKFSDNDLVLLEFVSDANYETANFPNLNNINANKYVNIGEKVYATGFASDDEGKVNFTTGILEFFPPKKITNGYRIGYTNPIKKGMSGGPILNQWGELIGLNSRHSYPTFGDPFVFQDGTRPSEKERKKMVPLSWGMPIEILAETASKFVNPPSQTLTGLPSEIERKAKQITVRIERQVGGGSGVIIASHKAEKENKYTCYVLTASHIPIKTEQDYTIIAPDNQRYTIKPGTEKKSEGLDFAVVSFTSETNYSVATLGNYELKDNSYIFVFGWPVSKNYRKPSSLLTAGWFLSPEKARIYDAKDAFSLQEGYELTYTNMTQGGMSGGPVFDTQERVIGIHGKTETQDGVNIGYSLGIPSKTILSLINNLGVQKKWLSVETSAPEFPTKEVDNILQMSRTIVEPSSEAKEEDWINYGNQLWRVAQNPDEHSKAIDAFIKAIEINPNSYIARYAAGLAAKAKRDYRLANIAFSKAVDIKPDLYAAWRQKGDTHYSLREYQDALNAYEKAIEEAEKQNEEDFVLYLWKGVVLYELKRYPQAINAYTKSIELKPHPYTYDNRGLVYSAKGENDNALKNYNEATRLKPDYAIAYSNKGDVYDKKKDYDNALKNYNKAIELGYKNANIYRKIGNIYYGDGKKDYDKALENYNKAINLGYKDANIYIFLGYIYSNEKQDYKKALDNYKEALKLDGKNANIYLYMGNVYKEQGKNQEAVENYDAAINLDPKNAYAYNNKGLARENMKDIDAAIADFQKASEHCGKGTLSCEDPRNNLKRLENKIE